MFISFCFQGEANKPVSITVSQASAVSASTSTFSRVAFPEGSVERLSEADGFLVDDAERKLQPGLRLENFDTRTKTEGTHNCFGVNCTFLVILSNHPILRVPN